MKKSTERPKRILVSVYSMDHVGGSELYTFDLLKELRRRGGLEIEFFTIHQGWLSERVQDELAIPWMSRDRYDLILASHNATVDVIHDKGPTVQICHGAILGLEHPSLYADYHVGITKEVCDSLTAKGYPNRLVLNGLDLNEKKPVNPVNDTLKTVLSLCQSEEANEMLANVCNRLGLTFNYFNKHKNPTFGINDEMNKADMVIGIGRSTYDAMACGRPCIVFDARDYNGNKADGYLEPELFHAFVQHNCSGRYRDLQFDEDDLMREFEKYNSKDGEKLREIAVEKLNVARTTQELLDVANLITWQTKMKKNTRVFRTRFRQLRRSTKRKLRNLF